MFIWLPAHRVTVLKVITFPVELRKRNRVGKALNSAYGLWEFNLLVSQGAFIWSLIKTSVCSRLRNGGDKCIFFQLPFCCYPFRYQALSDCPAVGSIGHAQRRDNRFYSDANAGSYITQKLQQKIMWLK